MTDEPQDQMQPENPPEAAADVEPEALAPDAASADEPVGATEDASVEASDVAESTASSEPSNSASDEEASEAQAGLNPADLEALQNATADSADADDEAGIPEEPGFTSDDPAVLGSPVAGVAAADAVPHDVPSFAEEERGRELSEIGLLDEVELDVKIELGRTHMYIEDVLRLHAGSVVELDKLAGDPVDIFVNERLVAHGEVLVLNDNFCVRVNDIISPIPEVDETN